MMYNPMLDYQRNQLLAQQAIAQNQMNQQSFNPYPQPQQPQYFVRQVGSFDEVKAYPVDPNVIYLFPDTGTGKIYFKRLNTDNGKSELYIYSPSQEGEDVKVVESDSNENILKRLDSIEKSIGGLNESISKFTTIPKYDEESDRNASTTSSSKNAKARP